MAADLPNVAQRLQLEIESARGQGFEIRKVVLDEQSPGWVRMGKRQLIFLDLSSLPPRVRSRETRAGSKGQRQFLKMQMGLPDGRCEDCGSESVWSRNVGGVAKASQWLAGT